MAVAQEDVEHVAPQLAEETDIAVPCLVALKPNKDLYEDFSYFPRRPTLEHFVRVIQCDELLTNIQNSLVVGLTTTAVTDPEQIRTLFQSAL